MIKVLIIIIIIAAVIAITVGIRALIRDWKYFDELEKCYRNFMEEGKNKDDEG